jgi:RNA polymerase sigma factor (sigma-70 family)
VNRGPAGRGDSALERREAGSFEDFFTEWYPRAVVLVMQRAEGAAEADAHDAVQNAMIKLLRCWGRPDHPKAYLITIAMREYARIVADRRRHGCVGTKDDQASAESDPSKEGEIDNRLLIVELVQKLPPAERDVAALDLCDLSTRQIAEILGKPEATVRSLRRNAHNHLKKALRDGGTTREGGMGP